MDTTKTFDELSYGHHFTDGSGRKFVKIMNEPSYRNSFGNYQRFNAIDYAGFNVWIPHDAKVTVIDPGNERTERGYTYEQENKLLWTFVTMVSETAACQCEALKPKGKLCPKCFASQFITERISIADSITLEKFIKELDKEIEEKILGKNMNLEKVVDNATGSDKVEESQLKNKQIETTKTMKQTYNTIKDAVIAAIETLRSSGSFSAHQVSQLIRTQCNTDQWEVLDCVARPNNQNIKFWINHDDVRRTINEMYANCELDNLGFIDRNFNGQFNEYRFDTSSVVTTTGTTTPAPTATAIVGTPISTLTNSTVNQRVDNYIKNQKSMGNVPTMKEIQSAVKTNGITCQDFYNIVVALGYNVKCGNGGINSYSKHYVD
jgi:hypothetical protein